MLANFGIFYPVEYSMCVVSMSFVIFIQQEYVNMLIYLVSLFFFFFFFPQSKFHLLKLWFQNTELFHIDIFKQNKNISYSWTGLLELHLNTSTFHTMFFICIDDKWLWM